METKKPDDLKYLQLLSMKYPNINSVSSELINLSAILNLPKGTEHFISDIHGEYEAFSHVLRNASGVVKNHIDYIFGTSMRESEKKEIATLIYYPEQKIEVVMEKETDPVDWYRITLHRLIIICKHLSEKYSRAKVRKFIPADFSYIIEELLHEENYTEDKQLYYNEIIETIVRLNQADRFIIAMSNLIQRLAIDRLHIIGDIYDRGSGAVKIMDALSNYHSFDIQWGNHDVAWMGAAAGSQALICNVIRISAKYSNLDIIEDGYGINLIPLATFALSAYKDDPCTNFMPDNCKEDDLSAYQESSLIAKMHKAIAVIQFKEEYQIIQRHPEFNMDSRNMLHKIDFENGTIELNGKIYEMNDKNFPTIDPKDPYALSPEEQVVIDKIKSSFVNSEKLQNHVRLLYSKGNMYKIYNDNLLFHGGIPFNDDGTLKEVTIRGKVYKGKDYLDACEKAVREGYFNTPHSEIKRFCMDIIWYMWCGENSPLFGKKKMATFERYFLTDKDTHKEEYNPYYKNRNDINISKTVLENFGLDPDNSIIINGHVPVKVSKGESPIKAGGRMFVIDGGFAKAYQKETGIAGYTLIYNSHGLVLVSHEPFISTEKAILDEIDIHSSTVLKKYSQKRILIKDTDVGKEILKEIEDLTDLLDAYQQGFLTEKI
ncbi:MAG: fructose-1,6-bisphosphatase [Firmicutes bacterium]|nr:fructose-1,6-bisphosphatase [Bacillota bacterium]MBR2594261.1 fructose-1,6-bisphosphatase [Bacillota bacterium]